MTCLIELPQAFEDIAAAQAQNNGKSVEEYLPELIVNALTELMHSAIQSSEKSSENRTARIQRFHHWTVSNNYDTPPLSDEEVSREAMYPQV